MGAGPTEGDRDRLRHLLGDTTEGLDRRLDEGRVVRRTPEGLPPRA